MKWMDMRNLYFGFVFLFLLPGALFFLSCTGDKVTAEEVRMIIGPYGGEVLGPKGTKLIFPPGALTYETPIILSEVPDDETPSNGDLLRISSVLWMRPEGLTFNEPVTVEMPYRAGGMTEATQLKQVAAFTSPRFMPDWRELSGTAETATHTFVFEIEHFSIAALFRLSEAEAECRCAWLGNWCVSREAQSCADVYGISLARNSGECGFTMDLLDAEGDVSYSESFDSCPIPEKLELHPGASDCTISFNGDSGAITMNCDACSIELHEDFCN